MSAVHSYQYVAVSGSIQTATTEKSLRDLRREFRDSITPLYSYDGKRIAPAQPVRVPRSRRSGAKTLHLVVAARFVDDLFTYGRGWEQAWTYRTEAEALQAARDLVAQDAPAGTHRRRCKAFGRWRLEPYDIARAYRVQPLSGKVQMLSEERRRSCGGGDNF